MVRRRLVAGAAVALLLGTVIAPAAAGATAPVAEDRSAFVVDLEADGDATVTLVLTYDLDDGNDEAAFDRLSANPENVTERFDDRLSGIADRTDADVDREMAVSNVSATFATTDGVGVVRLSASWSNLAAVDGDRLVVDEPFASEFRPDRPLMIVPPDGYTVVDTAIPAADGDGSTVEWDAGTDLSGFAATLAPSDSGDEEAVLGIISSPLVFLAAIGLAAILVYGGLQRS